MLGQIYFSILGFSLAKFVFFTIPVIIMSKSVIFFLVTTVSMEFAGIWNFFHGVLFFRNFAFFFENPIVMMI